MAGLDGIAGVAGVHGIDRLGAGDRAAAAQPPMGDFAAAIGRGVEQVVDTQATADAVAVDLATGGESGVHDLMAATTQAELSVDLLTQVRNRAVESYQEIMRLQL